MSTRTPQTLFLEPLDLLFLRGNKLFGEAGSHGDAMVPPWPSVAAGALRSRMLADDGVDLAAFGKGDAPHPTLGTPKQPGSFTLCRFQLAQRHATGQVEALYALPADLLAFKPKSKPLGASDYQLCALQPTPVPQGMACSNSLPMLAVARQDVREKPVGSLWLTTSQWQSYVDGKLPDATALIESKVLWSLDARVGIGLDEARRRADDGKLFSMQAVAFTRNEARGCSVGLLAGVSGATPPKDGLLRLGGDGRAARIHAAEVATPEPDWTRIQTSGRFRLILTSPGIFPAGWRPPGVASDTLLWDLPAGGTARLVCAAMARPETVSGWDVAERGPKAAAKAVPSGAVYWFEQLTGSVSALQKLSQTGLWDLAPDNTEPARRAEGFNRCFIAPWLE